MTQQNEKQPKAKTGLARCLELASGHKWLLFLSGFLAALAAICSFAPCLSIYYMVSSFAERAERVRGGGVDATIDNMLKITNDGRKCALDQRLINDMLPDEEDSKVNRCVKNAFAIWQETMPEKSTQLIFCDLSTPKNDGTFNVYDDLREKLVAKGIPMEEIAFIHDASTEAKKADLFAKVRAGKVRILLGSTPKLGAGTNIQDRLIALHHLDCPWKPSDLEQQEGRILRQGNQNEKVKIFRYVTENTFDSYMWVRHEVA